MKSLKQLLLVMLLISSFGVAQEQIVGVGDNASVSVGRGKTLAGGINKVGMVTVEARHCQDFMVENKFLQSISLGRVGKPRLTQEGAAACAATGRSAFYSHTEHNLTTNAGFDVISKAVSDTAAQPAACNYIAVTNTAVTPAIGDTTLSGEIAANGLTRAQAVFAHTTGTLTYTLTKVFTASGTQASQASAVFNASSTGSMCFENTYTAVTVNNGDTLTVTWTITLS